MIKGLKEGVLSQVQRVKGKGVLSQVSHDLTRRSVRGRGQWTMKDTFVLSGIESKLAPRSDHSILMVVGRVCDSVGLRGGREGVASCQG